VQRSTSTLRTMVASLPAVTIPPPVSNMESRIWVCLNAAPANSHLVSFWKCWNTPQSGVTTPR
jgi:hypothetical protein